MVNVTGMVAHAENKHPHEPVNPIPIGTNVSTALSPPAFGLVMDAVMGAELLVQPLVQLLVQLLVVPLLRPRAATTVKTRAEEMGIWAVSGIETWDATWCATTS
mmetsp:Transcript_13762/g.21262  ORF Transcript_13762/g.21262 Transcript_13762/m.21262 type:complete len:104 (+) Transcript_13762:201-512(+)